MRAPSEADREFFLHLFDAAARANPSAGEELARPFYSLVQSTWLRPILAEALITGGHGSPETWASLLSPPMFQALKDRTDVEFPADNPPFIRPGSDVKFDVWVKNTPSLTVNVYEVNALNFFLQQKRQINTDLNVDGLIPNLQKSIRVGQWNALFNTGPSGVQVTLLDETRNPVRDGVAWMDGRRFEPDPKTGTLTLPFLNAGPARPVVFSDPKGEFAILEQFQPQPESFQLDAAFHLEREQIIGGAEPVLGLRVALRLGPIRFGDQKPNDPRSRRFRTEGPNSRGRSLAQRGILSQGGYDFTGRRLKRDAAGVEDLGGQWN